MGFDRKLFIQSISWVKNVSKNVYLLSFSRKWDFIPGQVIAISTDLNIPARLYSIASGNKEEEIKILFDVIPDGILTNHLSKLAAGDTIYVSEPFGKFTGDNKPACWISTGTGIAPFASMFYSGLAENKVLIHGGRTLDSFYFEHDFLSGLGENYIRCCSGEREKGVFNGRVTDYIQKLKIVPGDYKYYLCGNAEMIVETRDILINMGIPFDKIIAEIYF